MTSARTPLAEPSRYIATPDAVKIAVYEDGPADAPVIVLVHGYPDNHTVWDGLVKELAGDFRVVRYDVRGAGHSQHPQRLRDYRLDRLASDLHQVAATVSPDKPVHVVGHDWGSIQAWEAVTDVGADRRIASFTTTSGPSLDHTGKWMRHTAFRPSPRNLSDAIGQALHSWYIGYFHTPVVAKLSWRLMAPRLSAIIGQVPSETLTADAMTGLKLYRANMIPRFARPRSRFTAVPVHQIVPTDDKFVRPQLAQAAEPWTPLLWRTTLKAPHWAPHTHAGELAEHVREFVGSLEADETPSAPAVIQPLRRRPRLDRKLAFITGAGSGIGQATALAMAREGARVIAADINVADAEHTVRMLRHHGGDAWAYPVDVTDPEATTALADAVMDLHGVPDLVVNNAGVAHAGGFFDTPLERWHQVMDVNFWGIVHGSRAFGSAMAERGSGHIVNVASAAAYSPVRILSAYSTSKSAALMASECLRVELASSKVGVTAICPGFVATNISHAATFSGEGSSQEEKRQHTSRLFAIKGYGPEKIAGAIIRSALRNRAVVPVTFDGKLARFGSRYTPGIVRLVGRLDPSG
ncbi:SDR family oxidoreductase [Salininema proteolyticum]|uniref:SDR family oxidoreductase n=1 Tax=Salininema proteolyticum TaxID=1607685 RepID=A0ABV8U114_9ACTN